MGSWSKKEFHSLFGTSTLIRDTSSSSSNSRIPPKLWRAEKSQHPRSVGLRQSRHPCFRFLAPSRLSFFHEYFRRAIEVSCASFFLDCVSVGSRPWFTLTIPYLSHIIRLLLLSCATIVEKTTSCLVSSRRLCWLTEPRTTRVREREMCLDSLVTKRRHIFRPSVVRTRLGKWNLHNLTKSTSAHSR